jgi:hypothetical protein
MLQNLSQSIFATLTVVCTIASSSIAQAGVIEPSAVSHSADLGSPQNITSCAVIRNPMPNLCKAQGSDTEKVPVTPQQPSPIDFNPGNLQLQRLNLNSDQIKVRIVDFQF